MALKRPADELDSATSRTRKLDAKRAKLSPTANDASNSSDPSSRSVSEDSALQSSPEQTRSTSMSSLHSTTYNGDSDCSVSSSSEESESESEVDQSSDDIVTIGGPKKPNMTSLNLTNGMLDLKSRLASFLPELAESNAMLQSGQESMNMEDVEEGGQHIEMDLGLGVLEEQPEDDEASSSEKSSDEDYKTDGDGEDELLVSSSQVHRQQGDRETDVMGKLQGRPKGRQKPGIEDLG